MKHSVHTNVGLNRRMVREEGAFTNLNTRTTWKKLSTVTTISESQIRATLVVLVGEGHNWHLRRGEPKLN